MGMLIYKLPLIVIVAA